MCSVQWHLEAMETNILTLEMGFQHIAGCGENSYVSACLIQSHVH